MVVLIGGIGVIGFVVEEVCERFCVVGYQCFVVNIDVGICFYIFRLQVFSDGVKYFYIRVVYILVVKVMICVVGYDNDVLRVIDINVLVIDFVCKIFFGVGI